MGQESDEKPGSVEDQVREFLKQPQDEFPLSRIEDTAGVVLESLFIEKGLVSKEDLLRKPESNDVLTNIQANDIFIRDRILPFTIELMKRTEQMVPVGRNSILGYAYIPIYSDKKGEEDEIISWSQSLFVEEDDYFEILNSPKNIQLAWDRSSKAAREDLRQFSEMTVDQVIDRFIEYTEEYV